MNKHILILVLLISSIDLFAQKAIDTTNYADGPNDSRMSYGVSAGVGLNIHSADFQKFQGVESCCPGYESGFGAGPYANLYTTIPLGDVLELYIKANYTTLSGKLSREENTTLLGSNDEAVDGIFEHRFKANLSIIAGQVGVNYKLSNEFRLNAGLRIGSLMSKNLDEHIEEITSPSNGVFTDTKKRTRNSYSGEIPNTNSLINSLILGATYDLPLNNNNTLFLVPEFNYSYTISSYIKDFTWNSMELSGGLGLKWAPRAVKAPKPIMAPPPPPPLPPPPPPPVAPSIDATLTAYSVNEDGKEEKVAKIKIEESLENKTHPLLNYIFFDEGSSSLALKYKRISENEKKNFSFKNFYSMKTMDVYYNVLNIVGRRLQFYPQSKITLVGCNSDENVEKGNSALSLKRAEEIKKYFTNEWKIEEDRITVQSRNLPELPSRTTDPDGIEENRRVEIIANFPQIFEPMIIYDTLVKTNIPLFRFRTSVKSEIGVSDWKIVASQQGKILKTFRGSGIPPKSIDWDISSESEAEFLPKTELPLEYQLYLTDNDGKELTSPKQMMQVEMLTIEKKIFEMMEDQIVDRFAMIGFGYDKADLADQNINIADKIKKRIDRESTVMISGLSDRLGNDDYNLKLSERRAKAVAKYLNVPEKNAKGYGEKLNNYNNDLPEGRFYNRTVKIDITTPVE